MTPARLRLTLLITVIVVALVGSAGYVLAVRHAHQQAGAAGPAVPTNAELTAVSAGPHLAFRSTALGAGYGQVALAPLTAPDGPRVITPAACDRVYAVAREALCLAAERGAVTTYRADLLGPRWTPIRQLPLTGLPSRVRLSRDGRLSATTTFVHGDSYTDPNEFSTRTIISVVDGSARYDLETFTFSVDGKPVGANDRNFWGVTFVDDDTFYATGESDERTWLVKGSISGRRLTAIRPDVECPSLSPDGTRIAFKKHGSLPAGQWHLAVYSLTTGRETLLAEPGSVDDQAEWLDDNHVIYGLPRKAAGTASSDIWVVPSDGTGAAAILVHDAWSPAVVR